jgi:signal transduction histidine kinase
MLDRLDGPLTSEQEVQLNLVQKSAIELSEMVNDQLDLAKIEAGRITVSPVWFEMVDLFAAVRGMFRPLLVKTDVQLIFEEPEEPIRLYTDDRKLAQILRNFISNALKFTEHGEIVVRAKLDDEMSVVFSVTDSGIGISDENVERIFEEFVQVDSLIQRSLNPRRRDANDKAVVVILAMRAHVAEQIRNRVAGDTR